MEEFAERGLRREELLQIITEMNDDVAKSGYQRKMSLYLVGGSLMSYLFMQRVTKDVDFILSRQDFRALGDTISKIERRRNIRIDVFPDGALPEFDYPIFEQYAVRLPSRYSHLDLFRIDDIGFLILKALADREKDMKDINNSSRSKDYRRVKGS